MGKLYLRAQEICLCKMMMICWNNWHIIKSQTFFTPETWSLRVCRREDALAFWGTPQHPRQVNRLSVESTEYGMKSGVWVVVVSEAVRELSSVTRCNPLW